MECPKCGKNLQAMRRDNAKRHVAQCRKQPPPLQPSSEKQQQCREEEEMSSESTPSPASTSQPKECEEEMDLELFTPKRIRLVEYSSSEEEEEEEEQEEEEQEEEEMSSESPPLRASTSQPEECEEEVSFEDPLECPPHLAAALAGECRECYMDNWCQIRTRQRGGCFVMVYTHRLEESSDIGSMLRAIFCRQRTAFKVNLAFGFLLQNVETGETRYFYPSQNGFVNDNPFVIANDDDLARVLGEIRDVDWQEYVRKQKPNSKWRVALLTNVAFHVYPLIDRPIGRGEGGHLPKWLIENRGVDVLEKDKRTGNLYRDNFCYFRCLSRHLGFHLKNLETKTKQLASLYLASLEKSEKFAGVKLQDLHNLDLLYDLHTFVYSLGEDGKVELVHRPVAILTKRQSEEALKLNLYGEHFSFIKKMCKYSKSYVCQRCEATFPKAHRLQRHERSCEAKVNFVYPGGVYHPSKTIFEVIEDEGVEVPEDVKYTKYRATFDIEVYYPKDNTLPEKRAKLQYRAEHHLLSISVYSNVPGYEIAKCFVREGEGRECAQKTVKEFVAYLEDMAQQVAALELPRFSQFLTSVEEALCPGGIALAEQQQQWQAPSRANPNGEEEEVIMVGFEGENSSEESDNEPDEDDLTFLDDDEEQAQEATFYHLVDLQRVAADDLTADRSSCSPAASCENRQVKRAKKLVAALKDHIGELVVVGFNSGKYDLNVLKDILIPHLVNNNEGIQFVVKRHHAYLVLKTGSLKFVDVSNFLAAGTNYAAFVKAYQCKEEKGFFPYEWVDSLDKLEHPSLPPHEAFHSWLCKSNISDDEYRLCETAWEREGMITMRDFLIWYNNLDVVPFLEALDKMCRFWREKNIDMLKQAISLPGLAFKFEMGFLKDQGLYLSSFHTEELYQLFKTNMVGGPAIIFHRYAEVEKTCIRNNPEKPVKKIVGYDANALYLWALCQPMPVGLYTTWTSVQDGLVPHKSWRMADEWLAWVGHQRRVTLRTRLNEGEKHLGGRQLAVDGYDASSCTVFEFNGCFWHGCPTCFDPTKVNERQSRTFGQLLDDTRAKSEYLQSLPSVSAVVQTWECEWYRERRANWEEIEVFLNDHFPGRGEKEQTQTRLLQRVRDGTFFGALEVDIHTPDHLKEKFSEMTPIFKNVEIKRQDLGECMQQFAEEHDIMSTPRRSLVGSYRGDKILLGTPLLKFYLEEGLVVTHVHSAIQWISSPWLQPFEDFVSTSRRAADADPHQKILGETAKLVGNAGFGRFLMDVSRHQDVRYEKDETKVARLVNSFFFRDLQELSDDVFELKMSKKKIKCDLPIQIGFFVFTYAKLKMLEFYYQFIDTYLDRQDYQYLEMDTDSAYMALAGDSIESLVKPHLKEEYEVQKQKWFPREDTLENAACDKRTPGLFKIEWSGDGFVGLNSKTYCCWGTDSNKASCKGISKRLNNPQKETYLRVLQSGDSESGENRGFRVVKNCVLTYAQHRTGFSYFYAKRKVLADGVTTEPLEI